MPYDALIERKVSAPRAKVFGAFYDFNGIGKLLPDAIASCECIGEGVGAVRTLKMAEGGTIVERMEIAHEGSVFGYSITSNDALPLENYCAIVMLADNSDGGTSVTYGSNWDPKGIEEDEMRKTLEDFYHAILDAIEKS
ncbi:MAG: SRPBCC family protein [Gammaproteobacteria bacterium]|jgi:hypothetical protein|nr:SRPBCC family protein [Gammaproteobacteria bacterium]